MIKTAKQHRYGNFSMTANLCFKYNNHKSESGISLEKVESGNVLTASFWRSFDCISFFM